MKRNTILKKFRNYNININFWLRSIFYVGILLLLVSKNSYAKESNSISQKISLYQEDLKNIEIFLNNISNLSANFIQNSQDINSNSKSSINDQSSAKVNSKNLIEGKFYLVRSPTQSGKMRIEYLADPKIVIVVNGSILSYHDIELDEISRISTNTTPASFLTRPNISFSSKDVQITNIQKDNNFIKISLLKKNRKDAGEFSLIFKNSPLEFVKMEVKNDLGQIVSVTLNNIDMTSSIPNKFFVIKDNNF
jgi:outer membrane lipoprotein-sorting protein